MVTTAKQQQPGEPHKQRQKHIREKDCLVLREEIRWRTAFLNAELVFALDSTMTFFFFYYFKNSPISYWVCNQLNILL